MVRYEMEGGEITRKYIFNVINLPCPTLIEIYFL